MKKRLELKKLTVANLNADLQGNVFGGAPVTYSCPDNTCQTQGCPTVITQCGQATCYPCGGSYVNTCDTCKTCPSNRPETCGPCVP